MLVLLFAAAQFLCAVQASSFPSLTSFGNATTIAPSGAAVTGCVQHCTRSQSDLSFISWSQMSITATFTAETLLYIVNNRTNSTRTSTIKNTEINFNNISAPTSTNDAGTVTASFSLMDGRVVSAVYPTNVYEDYPSTYSFCGTLPTIINGDPTCLRNPCTTGPATDSRAGIYTFPSHPPLPVSTQTNADVAQDPRGWTYVPAIAKVCEDEELIKPMFPNLGFWSCSLTASCALANAYLNTALYLTVTSTSHEAVASSPQATSAPPSSLKAETPLPPTNTPIGSPSTQDPGSPLTPFALASADALIPPITDTPSPAPAATNKPESAPAPAPAHVSQPPLPPQAAANAPATSLPPPSQQAPGNAANVPPKQPALAANPSPPNQQASSNAPAPNQQAPGNAAINPPKQPATAANPPAATIIPMAVTLTNKQGDAVVSTTPVPAIPVLHSSTNAQGSVAVSTSFSQLKANAPITLVPQPIKSTNAQGSVIITSSYAAAIPVLITTTNAQGQPVISISTSFSPTPTIVPATPIALIPTTITTTNAQGSSTVSTATAAIIPIAVTTTNSLGQLVISTSLSTAPLTATANIILTTTNAQGILVPFTTNVPAILLTTTDAQGSQTITTSPLFPVTTQAPLITIGSQIITANSKGQYIIGSQTLTAGGAITVSGTPISLAPGDTAVVIGTSTEGLAGLITAGFGAGPGGNGNGSGNGSVVAFTGGAAQGLRGRGLWAASVVVLLGMGLGMGMVL